MIRFATAVWGGILAGAMLVGPAAAADKHDLFMAQATVFAETAGDAERVARCGLRSEEWSQDVEADAKHSARWLADNLWSWRDAALVDASGQALHDAYAAIEAARKRAADVTPQWCADVWHRPPEWLRRLDEDARRGQPPK